MTFKEKLRDVLHRAEAKQNGLDENWFVAASKIGDACMDAIDEIAKQYPTRGWSHLLFDANRCWNVYPKEKTRG